jgi:hypothetical protein
MFETAKFAVSLVFFTTISLSPSSMAQSKTVEDSVFTQTQVAISAFSLITTNHAVVCLLTRTLCVQLPAEENNVLHS